MDLICYRLFFLFCVLAFVCVCLCVRVHVCVQPGTVSAMDHGLNRLVDPNAEEVKGETLCVCVCVCVFSFDLSTVV